MANISVKIPFDLSKVGEDITRKVDDEILATALEIETLAKEKAPFDTGRLRSSINTVRNDKSVSVLTPVFYSLYMEFGTKYVQARPFLYPAFFDRTRRLTARIAKIIMA